MGFIADFIAHIFTYVQSCIYHFGFSIQKLFVFHQTTWAAPIPVGPSMGFWTPEKSKTLNLKGLPGILQGPVLPLSPFLKIQPYFPCS